MFVKQKEITDPKPIQYGKEKSIFEQVERTSKYGSFGRGARFKYQADQADANLSQKFKTRNNSIQSVTKVLPDKIAPFMRSEKLMMNKSLTQD
jgi:hypothetical protein